MSNVDIMLVPDVHEPCSSADAKKVVVGFAQATKPRLIVQLGDLYDEYLLSRFGKEPEYVDRRIIKDGKKRGYDFLVALRAAAREKVLFIPGNHEDRLQARLGEVPFLSWWVGPQRQPIPEGVEWVEAKEVILRTARGPVYVTHGWRTRDMAGNAAQSMVRDRSVVVGHTHKLALAWRTDRYFAMEAGWLGDPKKYAFAYKMGKEAGCFDWTQGFGWLDTKGRPYIERI